ncbi:MAG: ATP-grasp domain-containing protein [Thioalkalivibrio sp.]
MADRLVQDITAIPSTEVLVARDPRIPHHFSSGVQVLSGDSATVWREGLAAADAVWLIAPESGGVLARLTSDIEDSESVLLTSRTEAVTLAGSKYRTIRCLEAFGIRVVPTTRPGEALAPHAGEWIVKPDDGAGCEGLRILSRECLGRWMLSVDPLAWVIQPLCEGDHLSLCLLCREGLATVLSINRQIIRRRGDGFVLEGCHVNIPEPSGAFGAQLRETAAGVAAAIPGLRGIIGVDLLLTPSGPRVLEINPRLTTSYTGLHRALGINPAGMVLDLVVRGTAPPVLKAYRTETVWLHPQNTALNHA